MPFDIALLIPLAALSIPIVAIGASVVDKIVKSQERRLEMRLRLQQGRSEESQTEIDGLRREIAALRDTSTQFDVSLSSSVERLEQRVNRVETKQAATSAGDDVQRVGLR